jgi:protein TonB
MSSDKRKVVEIQTPDGDYEAKILDFLDREISASAKPAPEQSSSADDVDAMVSDLLKQAISAPDEQETAPDTTGEELESLLSGILTGPEAAPAQDSHAEGVPKPGQPLRKSGGIDKEQKLIRQSEPDRSREIAHPTRATPSVLYHPAAADPMPATAALPLRPISAPDQHQKTGPSMGASTAAGDENRSVFAAAPQERTGRGRMFAIGAASLLLLGGIGAGVYYFAGHGGGGSSRSGNPSAPTVPAASVETAIATPTPTPPAPVPAKMPSAASSDRPAVQGPPLVQEAVNRQVPAAPAADKGKNQPQAKAPESVQQSIPAAQSDVSPLTSVIPPAPRAAGGENAAQSTEPARQEITVPPAIIAAPMPPPDVILGQPVPASTPSVEAMTRVGAQSSAARRVTAAVLVSRVTPVYPEAARRMRITGTVPLEIDIDENGRVVKATPVGGPPVLRSAAADAVLKWRFKPAAINNTNVRSQGRVSIVFEKP